MINNVFAYGTLMLPEIQKALTGKEFFMQKAKLNNYKRFAKPRTNRYRYRGPTIIEDKNSFVEGEILFNLDTRSWNIIDSYEGKEYEKKFVKVIVDNKKIQTITYVASKELKQKLDGEWKIEIFIKESLNYYLKIEIPKLLKLHTP